MTEDLPHLKKARILIVDDNPANVLLLEKVLKRGGYENVWSTTDARDARDLYVKWRHDLVLLDVSMPYLDGFEVLELLSQASPGDYVPVIFLTAQTDNETRLKALKAGALDFMTKPFQKDEILLRVRNVLMVRDYHNMTVRHAEILESEVRKRTLELEETRLDIIHRLGRAAEYRDNETGNHVIRMSLTSKRLAEAAGLDAATCELILQASPMHDVGKIGISDTILLKPGKLTLEEWEIMKTHSAIGCEILDGGDSDILELARSIALSHHEKWDGSGYPQGLAGEDIPIEGRITAICDVFDALQSRRPYKEPWSLEDTVAQINKDSGSHFDPDLIDIFNDLIDEFVALRDSHAD